MTSIKKDATVRPEKATIAQIKAMIVSGKAFRILPNGQIHEITEQESLEDKLFEEEHNVFVKEDGTCIPWGCWEHLCLQARKELADSKAQPVIDCVECGTAVGLRNIMCVTCAEKKKPESCTGKSAHADTLESRIQELEEARNKHWRGEEIAVRQLEIVKAQGEALAKALERGLPFLVMHREAYRQAVDALSTYRTANPDKGGK